MNKYKGLTLTEILVTIAIVGTVAALSIPVFVSSDAEDEFKIKWQNQYKELQKITDILSIKGEMDITNTDAMRNSYGRYLNYLKIDEMRNIFSSPIRFYKNTSSVGWDISSVIDSSVILNNGAFIKFDEYDAGNCNITIGSVNNVCGDLHFDSNGEKGPNMYGVDNQIVWLIKNNGDYKIVPAGSDDGKTCVVNSTTIDTSVGCSAIALTDDEMP